TGGRVVHGGVKSCQYSLRHGRGEAVCLDVGGRPVETELVGEPTLQHAVASNDCRRSALARSCERDTPVRSDVDPPVARQALQSDAHRRGADAQPIGETAGPHRLTLGCDAVDRLQVVVYGLVSTRSLGRGRGCWRRSSVTKDTLGHAPPAVTTMSVRNPATSPARTPQ